MPEYNNPLRAPDNGEIGLPPVGSGMNKITPTALDGGKGAKNDKAILVGRDAEKKLLDEVRKRMDRSMQDEAENRRDALDDVKFRSGDQWPADVVGQRNFDKRPCLTINKIPTFIHQITNDQRQNRPAINISPVGDRGDPEVAKMYRGLIRAIERHCNADIAYDTAFDCAVTSGWGYFRIRTEYEAPDSMDQIILTERIANPFTVYAGPHIQPDGSDMTWCFITEMMQRSEFEAQYPDADPMPFSQAGIGDQLKSWVTKDEVRVAEYYRIKNKTRTLVQLSNGHVGYEDDLADETKAMLRTDRLTIVKQRESQVPKVEWFKVTAVECLETKECPGKYIPVVKVIGDEVNVQGKTKYSGIVRFVKDSQRMYNYWATSETEIVALQPKAPYVMEEGQIEGHEAQWKQANTKNYPVLLYKGTNVGGKQAPPPQRQAFAGVPLGIVNAKQAAAQDMMATTGIRFDATMNERMIDESGKAIRELRRSGDIGSFHYVDNLARSLKHAGEIYMEYIPVVYDTKRQITILREDDSEEQIALDPNAIYPFQEIRVGNKVRKIFNPKIGDYGVTVTIGPSYATKRIEASENMMAFAKALPNTAGLIADLIAKNQDWPGAEEMATRLAKAVPPQLMTPDQKDITPQVQAVMQNMDQQIKALTGERQQLIAALTEKQTDRAQEQDRINKDFEGKLLKILADIETKTAATEERAVGQLMTHITALLAATEKGKETPKNA